MSKTLVLEGQKYRFLDAGSYADVFIDEPSSKVWKVFRKFSSDKKSQSVFKSEVAAYQLVQSSDELLKITPAFFRSAIRDFRVTDGNGVDITEQYEDGLNYELEYVDANFCKIRALQVSWTSTIEGTFQKHGIRHTSDASIAKLGDGSIRVIDFAVAEFELWHS